MKIKIQSIAMLVGIVGSVLSAFAQAGEVDLRGYGKVTATITPSHSEFVCESEAKADILMGKLLADMFWDAGTAHIETTVDIQGQKVVVHEWQPYGAVVVSRNKSHVFVIGASDTQSIVSAVTKEKRIIEKGTLYKPSNPYPRYLNFFDLESFKSYTHGQNLPQALTRRWAFSKQFMTGGLSMQHAGYKESSPANGVTYWDFFDYEFASSEKENSLYTIAISTGVWPSWAVNLNPHNVFQESSTSVNPDDFAKYTADGESFGLTPEERRKTSLKFLKNVMLRYKDSPVLSCWQLYCASYCYETCFSRDVQGTMDHSLIGLEGYRRWLRDVRKYSLSGLGERWHGDAKHFKSWSEVILPEDRNGFFGNLNEESYRITENWHWRLADEKQTTVPAAGEAGWIPLEWSPSQERRFLPREDLYYRVSFNADAWVKKNGGKEFYLACSVNAKPLQSLPSVWLNDKLVEEYHFGEYSPIVRMTNGTFALNVTKLLKPGKNDLAFKVAKPGSILGSIFLTTEKPTIYPYLGKLHNARYVDMAEWQVWALNNKVTDTVEYTRSIDPDRPLVIPPGSSIEVGEGQADICSRYGVAMEMTGREAWYHPWWPRMGYIGGFYGVSEPSAIIRTAAKMNQEMGWMLQDGDSSHMLFWDVDNYIDLESKTGWFTHNKRLLELFGKYLPEKSDIVILRSSLGALLLDDIYSGMRWDIGRGEIQASHFDALYASESMVANGLIDGYPVLFDCGTEVMKPETVEAIRRYVENGGVFIALHNTGRHDILEADTWPISKLTGFKVLDDDKQGTIYFANNLPLFKGWEGKEFEGEGSALDHYNQDSGKKVGLSLQAQDSSTVALAKWGDGSIAIGMRKVGKGKVITLGSTFWRSGKDVSGMWRTQSELESEFLEKLFVDLGISRNASAQSRNVWTRKAITKNGLQEWLLASNSTDAEVTTNLEFTTAEKPSQVWDMIEQKPVSFEYENGWVKIKDVVMPSYVTKVYGVKNNSLAGGVNFWWEEKIKFWKSSKVKPLVEAAPQPDLNPPTIPFEIWKFMADRNDALAAKSDWRQPDFNDTSWKAIKTGLWNCQDESLKDYKGVGLYRSLPFSVPEGWAKNPVTFNISRSSGGTYFDKGEIYLNGNKIADFDGNFPKRSLKCEVAARLKKDGNVLAVKVTGAKDLCGLASALWMERELKSDAVVSLQGEWQAVQKDYLTRKPATLPGKVSAKYITREFSVPNDWRGKNIYLNAEFSNESTDRLMINGKPMLLGTAYTQLNLTPYLRFEKNNTLEIWSKKTDTNEELPFQVIQIEIAREGKL